MPPENKVVAIVCSDLHLSLKPPVYRSDEPDWFLAMQRPLDEIRRLQKHYGCDVLCCGDVFNDWNSSAELINWSIGCLPKMHSIPGQHDLPNHNHTEIHRSAYQTLLAAKKILPMSDLMYLQNSFDASHPNVVVNGFEYGEKILKGKSASNYLHVVLIHQYSWVPECSYIGAPAQSRVTNRRKEFEGYDVVFAGDNHIPFVTKINKGKTTFVNCGAIMRRKSDDDFQPSVWLLHEDGYVGRVYLDVSKDVYLPKEKVKKKGEEVDISSLVKGLSTISDAKFDFGEMMKQYLEKENISQDVADVLLRAMEK
jgi:DNA repair exonuclease SbcCD nuclease subunit